MLEVLKSVARHFVVYGLGNLLNKVVSFILIPVYTHYLAAAEYGTLELLELTQYIASMCLALGIGSSVLRCYYDSADSGDRKQTVSTAFFSIWGLALGGGAILLLASPGISVLVFSSPENTGLFRLVFVALMFGLANDIPLAFIRAQQKSGLYTIVSLSRFTLSLCLNILFIVHVGWGMRGVILSSVINQVATSVFLGCYTLRWCGLHFSSRKLKHMLRYGLPLIPSGLGLFVMNFADRFFLQRFATLTEVGIYGLGYKFGMLMNPLIAGPYETILRPKMFELAGRDDVRAINSLLFTYFMCVVVFFGLGMAVAIKDALKIISGPEYHRAYLIVPFIVLSYIFNAAYVHMQVGILIAKKTKYISCVVGIAALSNLCLNVVLTPRLGMWGAALATLLSFVILFAINLLISRKLYHVKYEYTRVMKLLAVALVYYLISLGITLEPPALALCVKAVWVFSFPFALQIVKFYTPREIRKIRETATGVTTALRGMLPGHKAPG